MSQDSYSISFLIPTYNAAKYLHTCLSSIRGQNYNQEQVEIIIADGGSQDNTRSIAKEYNCVILDNPRRLAEYGLQVAIKKCRGALVTVFAADNELVGNNWVQSVVNVFQKNSQIAALWGKLKAGTNDPSLNKYFELIQSDPLNWFVNKNLKKYLKNCSPKGPNTLCCFNVEQDKPLVWGANGLTYRTSTIKPYWQQEAYLGDNDVFQNMIEGGQTQVAYFDIPFVYHHHVAKLGDWVKKWERNTQKHLIDKAATRNMNWVFTKSFKRKLALWVVYSIIPIFSGLDSLKNAVRDKNMYWFYHPVVSLMQTLTYTKIFLFSNGGLKILSKL